MLRIGARAKINWTLDITGRRADGYHLMDMLMQSVTLADEITLEKTLDGEITLTTGGTPLLPADEHHLALRAARALQKATSCPLGARIHVVKHIPVGAGMGGGSSDAAGVLVGLNRLWETGLTRAELEDVGLTLGADVPFCIRGGLTRTRGIGEAMQELPCGRCFPLVVIQPCGGLSTRDVFAAYHAQAVSFRPDNDAAQAALADGDLRALSPALGNVLQPVSEQMRPAIADAIADLRNFGAAASLMTGSGSAVFGAFETKDTADAAFAALEKRYGRVFRCETCMESVIEQI